MIHFQEIRDQFCQIFAWDNPKPFGFELDPREVRDTLLKNPGVIKASFQKGKTFVYGGSTDAPCFPQVRKRI
jgi:hypothetical protein